LLLAVNRLHIDLPVGWPHSGFMSLASNLTRLPRAFDAELGADACAVVPALTGDMALLVAGAAGSSPYLKGLIEREADWLPGACDDPDTALMMLTQQVQNLAPDQLRKGLRVAKRRIALITALADLGGAWPLERVTGVLTEFAGLACDVALKAEIANLIKRGKLSGQEEDDIATAGGLIVLAMGKMGADELNYSSDIDLICLFDETRYEPDDYYEVRTAMVRATRAMSAALNDRTEDGYVFRTDLRLRPDPSVTPVCMATEPAERYYESLGRTWERAAFIKARAAAGDITAGQAFLKTLTPFVWRRHLDFAAIQDAHDMRLRIREEKGLGGPLTVPGHNMKLGRGGIREIEFFTQTRQLIAGGRDPDLRLRGTTQGLAALADKDWVPRDVADTLTDHYRQHRLVEHRIQMVNDAQTHDMPRTVKGIERIACLMGIDAAELTDDLTRRLTEVHGLTEGFFVHGAVDPVPVAKAPDSLDTAILARWITYPALRSQRAAQIFERLRPELLSRLAKTARPAEALVALDGFLAGLPAGVQLFSLFKANPSLIDLLIDIVGTSPALASHLARNSAVFDAVIGGGFFTDWPRKLVLQEELDQLLAAETDYEAQLDATRRWAKEWHFRIGVHHLRGLINATVAGTQYADLADCVIAGLLPVVTDQFAKKHGPPPGRGAVVVGMGSLGAQQLNAMSDLDVILIYDPLDADTSLGPRPLPSRLYYARLTQALITALTAPMAQGRLYEVDMRLRPSGNQGPVATSWASFQDYQRNTAWVWEHLALTRARVVAGDAGLGADIEAFRGDILKSDRSQGEILSEVKNMRARLAAAKSPDGIWDAKTGAGRMLDIELLAQAGALLVGSPDRDVSNGLSGAVARGWLDVADAAELADAYQLLWSLQAAARLLSGKTINVAEMGEGGAGFLCRSTGFDNIGALETALSKAYGDAGALISAALDKGTDK
jgi:[glutamine synthetase] adenylyltransferase / [glutamine synthetase]-adenylyl-L-tyrosine phosphorylase